MIPIKGNLAGYELKGHTGPIRSLVFSYDGKYLYSASLDGKVLKWDLAARTSSNIPTEQMQINSIDISTFGSYMAGISSEGKVLVWNSEKPSDNFRIESNGKSIKAIRFKPGTDTIAVGYNDGYVELWDLIGKKKVSETRAHTADVNDIQFNKSLSQMATASKDGTLKIWDTRDLTTPPISFNDNDNYVMVIEFSPDGQFIVSGTLENTKNLVGRPTTVDILATDICQMVSRNFTPEEWSTYVGKDVVYEKTCSDKEYNIKVNVIK